MNVIGTRPANDRRGSQVRSSQRGGEMVTFIVIELWIVGFLLLALFLRWMYYIGIEKIIRWSDARDARKAGKGGPSCHCQ